MSVIEFMGLTTVPEQPNVILDKAKCWGLQQVIVVGVDEDGGVVVGGSHCEHFLNIGLLESAKHHLFCLSDYRKVE